MPGSLLEQLAAAFSASSLAAHAADRAAGADADGSPDALPLPPAGLTHLPASRVSRAVGGGERGLYLRGDCAAGDLVALYPGVVFDLSDLPMMHTHLLRDNGYVIMRRDGVLIDARQAPPSSSVWEMACARERACGREPPAAPRENVWALGHYANHPPCGMEDNVRLIPLDMSRADVEAVGRRWIPNVNFRPPVDGDWAIRTVALVALRPIAHGEEVLLDYRLSSDADRRPAWYRPVARQRALDEERRTDPPTSQAGCSVAVEAQSQRWAWCRDE